MCRRREGAGEAAGGAGRRKGCGAPLGWAGGGYNLRRGCRARAHRCVRKRGGAETRRMCRERQAPHWGRRSRWPGNRRASGRTDSNARPLPHGTQSRPSSTGLDISLPIHSPDFLRLPPLCLSPSVQNADTGRPTVLYVFPYPPHAQVGCPPGSELARARPPNGSFVAPHGAPSWGTALPGHVFTVVLDINR